MNKKLRVIGILLELIGLAMILFFQVFMQEEYSRKVNIEGKHIILMIIPENRALLFVGFFVFILGFIFIVIREINPDD